MHIRLMLAGWLMLVSLSTFAQAEIRFEDKVQKFEKVEAGQQLSFDFFYTNTGDQPLIISDIKVACSCTEFTYNKKPVMPGKREVIKVTFNTKTVYGWQDRILEVHSNAKDSPAKIRFKGNVERKK